MNTVYKQNLGDEKSGVVITALGDIELYVTSKTIINPEPHELMKIARIVAELKHKRDFPEDAYECQNCGDTKNICGCSGLGGGVPKLIKAEIEKKNNLGEDYEEATI